MSKKIKILIIDDDDATREMYSEVFRKADFDVLAAKDGLEGMDVATKELPDVIFTGIIMPRMDGFSLMENLKKNVATVNIPVVISSHLGREEDQEKAKLLGVKDFIIRGMVSPIEVVERVSDLFLAECRLQFDPYALDAARLAKELGLNNNFQCLECNEKMILKLKSIDTKNNIFEARFACPNCGWMAKK
jgi:PleD family two-component response regulator